MANDDIDNTTGDDSDSSSKNWRERLGINKDLPKIAAEFREEKRTPPRPASERPSVRVNTAERPLRNAPSSAGPGQPVASPAPMAPRAPVPKPAQTSGSASADANGAATEAPVDRPGSTEPPADSFSARLRAQREAAERLAQQRLSASRNAANMRAAATPATNDVPQATALDFDGASNNGAGEPRPAPAISDSGIQPKFSFAPEELGQPTAGLQPADAVVQPPAAPSPPSQATAASMSSPQLRPTLPPGYQPAAAPSTNMPPLQAPSRTVPPTPSQQPPVAPLRSPRPIAYEDENLEDVFEDTSQRRPVSPRASIDDYNAAYREFDDAYEDEEDTQRSGSGPVILILALLTVAAIAGALVYFYRSGTPGASTGQDQIPVITAPDKPVKTEPDQAAQPAQPAQPIGRKQIYDRILGEETLEQENIVPSEEVPQVPKVEQLVPSQETGTETEALPLPLPPPPGSSDQQGGLQLPDANQTVARMTEGTNLSQTGLSQIANSGRTDQQAINPSQITAEPQPSSTVSQTAIAAIPPPEPLAQTAGSVAAATEASEPAAGTVQTQPTTPITQVLAPRAAPPRPRVKPRQRVATNTAPQTQTALAPAIQPTQPQAFNSGPAILAPQPNAPATTQTQTVDQAPSLLQKVLGGTSGTTTRRATGGRLSDEDPLADIRRAQTGGTPTATAPAQQLTALQPQTIQPAPTQLAPSQPSPALVAPTQPAPAPAPTTTSSGYVVQLASYRTETEAQIEFQRLRSRHSGLLGNLSQRIQKAELGAAGTFYRLGVGTLNTKQSASNLCNSLIAAGEKDCLVRRQ